MRPRRPAGSFRFGPMRSRSGSLMGWTPTGGTGADGCASGSVTCYGRGPMGTGFERSRPWENEPGNRISGPGGADVDCWSRHPAAAAAAPGY